MLSLVLLLTVLSSSEGARVRNVFWNTSSLAGWPGGYRTVVVNQDNPAWEYDQVNIICPVAREGEEQEQHIIYSVGQEEFRACRVTSPRPRIVAVCNKPSQAMYFTLTFRSFTPTPGALEFRPGQDYYFVSTSSRRDLHRRVGGYCTTHNMRMVIRVAQTQEEEQEGGRGVKVASPRNYWEQWRSNGGEGVLAGGGGEGVLGGGGGEGEAYRRPKALIGSAASVGMEPQYKILICMIYFLKCFG